MGVVCWTTNQPPRMIRGSPSATPMEIYEEKMIVVKEVPKRITNLELLLIVLSIFYLAVNHSFMVVLLLLVIFGPTLILAGDFLESRQKTERKVGICIICGKKLSITKNLCLNCLKDYDVIKLNQIQLRFIS